MQRINLGKRACAVLILCAATAIATQAQSFKTMHSFDGTDGARPSALIQGTDGDFYGTGGGGAYTGGTVFKITTNGILTTVYSFCAQSGCADGQWPGAALIQATDGNFYGTTGNGGAYGAGEVFEITPRGTLTTLYSFCSQSGCTDGQWPGAALIQATDGNFYGTTPMGGAYDHGTVFKVTPAGVLTTLYSFCSQTGCADGVSPAAALIQASDGSFYGTTSTGGADNCTYFPYGCGTIFKITPSGTLTTLHTFAGTEVEGLNPWALIQGTDGNFYGTTGYGGGANGVGCGTVFRLTPSGTFTMLYTFSGDDGAFPWAGLIQATDGNFYGTTSEGGADFTGIVFEITPGGTLTQLHSFVYGQGVYANSLVQGTNGRFYGTSIQGGTTYVGTIFLLSTGLGPFVETEPTFGKAGKLIKILGTNLTGATSVTFNGTPAVFTVLRNSVISATVPVGATTGTVQVVTPGGTLSSNVLFHVKP